MSDDGQQFYEQVARQEEWESVCTDPEYLDWLQQLESKDERSEENRT